MKKWWQSIGKTDIRNVLSVLGISGSLLLLFILVFVEMPERNKELLNVMAGNIIGVLIAGIVGFYFGSSKADKANTENGGGGDA